jgi:tRNA pseudouridine38-40 synthase
MRYFISFVYDGTPFHGSQTQPNGVTVQAEMEASFATILRVPVPLTFAGRTDAGVHAEKMVAHFDYDKELPANLVGRLNNLLPPSIAITGLQHVRDDAHARFDATARTYHYRITTRKDPFLSINHTRVAAGLDYEAMNRAAALMIGTQDFGSFCRTHTDVKTTICDVREARWVQENETEAYFVITANRFLRNMVRAVVGTLFEVGRGKMTEAQFADIINAHDRCKAGHSAPPEGLSLVDIQYPQDITINT